MDSLPIVNVETLGEAAVILKLGGEAPLPAGLKIVKGGVDVVNFGKVTLRIWSNIILNYMLKYIL